MIATKTQAIKTHAARLGERAKLLQVIAAVPNSEAAREAALALRRIEAEIRLANSVFDFDANSVMLENDGVGDL